MLTPAYKLTIGQKVIDTTDKPQASTVVDLKVSLDIDTPADSVTVLLGRVGTFKPQRDDAVSVELGYADEDGLTQVATSAVAELDPTLIHTRLVCYSAAFTLLRSFADRTFENAKAGDIVKDLCKTAGVGIARADDGITFPAYVIDGRRSVYHHLQDLAALSGLDVYVDADAKLVFERFVGGKTVHVLEHAKHILDLEIHRTSPVAGQIQAFGESPGAGKGDEAWAWLTKDFAGLKGSAGSAAPAALLERPALRTAAAAATAAQADLSRIQRRALRGRVLTWGSPLIKLGDAIRLADVPDGSVDQPVQVRAVTHRISKHGGFTSLIDFRSAS